MFVPRRKTTHTVSSRGVHRLVCSVDTQHLGPWRTISFKKSRDGRLSYKPFTLRLMKPSFLVRVQFPSRVVIIAPIQCCMASLVLGGALCVLFIFFWSLAWNLTKETLLNSLCGKTCCALGEFTLKIWPCGSLLFYARSVFNSGQAISLSYGRFYAGLINGNQCSHWCSIWSCLTRAFPLSNNNRCWGPFWLWSSNETTPYVFTAKRSKNSRWRWFSCRAPLAGKVNDYRDVNYRRTAIREVMAIIQQVGCACLLVAYCLIDRQENEAKVNVCHSRSRNANSSMPVISISVSLNDQSDVT